MVHVLSSPMAPVYSFSNSSKITKHRPNPNHHYVLPNSNYHHFLSSPQFYASSTQQQQPSNSFYRQHQLTDTAPTTATTSIVTSFSNLSQSYQNTSATIDSSPFYTEPITPASTPPTGRIQQFVNFHQFPMSNSNRRPTSSSSNQQSTSNRASSSTARGSNRARGRRTGPNSNLRCDICNQYYSRRDNLRAHQRVHSGEKPYECRYCHSRFRWAGALRTHEGIHERNGDQATPSTPSSSTAARSGSGGRSSRSARPGASSSQPIPNAHMSQSSQTAIPSSAQNSRRHHGHTSQGLPPTRPTRPSRSLPNTSGTSTMIPPLSLPMGSAETSLNFSHNQGIITSGDELAVSPLFQDVSEPLPGVLDDILGEENSRY